MLPRHNLQRAGLTQTDTRNQRERLAKYESTVLHFPNYPDIALANNRAERHLPMSKVKQKMSGCFVTPKCAEANCRISSYRQSVTNQGYNPPVAIQVAPAGRVFENVSG